MASPDPAPEPSRPPVPDAAPAGSPGEVFLAFLRLGLTSFGGPIAHLGYFRDEFVTRRRWCTDAGYAELLAICQFIPGPASSQLGIAIGLQRAGARGAALAWLAFTLPSAVLLVALAAAGTVLPELPLVRGALLGVLAGAVGIVAHAVASMAAGLAPDAWRRALVLVALALALLLPGAPGQVLAILCGVGAGIARWGAGRRRLGAARGPDPGPSRARAAIPIVSRRIGLTAAALLVALLVGLPLAARIWPGLLVGIADAFTRAGALVFGGGHVVLPLLGAEPVIADGIDPAQFLGAYGAAQAVPGPLFTFAAPLGFELGAGVGLGWGALGTAALALVAVFVPGVLWLLAALSAWDAVRARAWAAAGISGANAAVVGILAAAFVTPVVPAGVTGWLPLAFACLVFVLLTLARWPAWLVVIGCAVGGAVAALCGVPSGW